MERLRLGMADMVLFGLYNASLLFTLGYYLTGLQVEYRQGFATEDGPIEWGTAICLLFAGLVLFRNAARLMGRGAGIAGILTLIYGVVFLFGAGEEISWGQRVFGWEAGEFFREHNAQRETNIHNLVVGDVKLVNTLFGPILTFVVLLYLVVLPLLYSRLSAFRRLGDGLAIPVPAMRHTVLTLVATVVIGILPMMAKWETYEFVFSLLCVSIVLAPRNAGRVT
ncbi:hypothetical protein [Roseovarius salis]|uniref:hypothetical protein n=1 Tax=Roseovarius salis TaxID=3376063 RepID=UPI0037CA137F